MLDDLLQRRLQRRTAVLATAGVCAAALAAATRETADATQTPEHWVHLGPAPMVRGDADTPHSGRIASITVDPSNPDRWLVGVGNGGVWETRDTGRTWTAIADDAPTLATGAVTFAPSDANVIYVATGEAINRGYAHAGLGILRSTDSGRTWLLLGESAFRRVAVKRLRVHPTNPGVVMAASSRGGAGRDASADVRPRPPSGILKSIDGGANWSRRLGGQATALEIDPANFNNQYAAIGEQTPGFVDLDPPGSAANGVYRSVDGGETWNLVDGPWGTDYALGRIEVAMAPSNPNVVYVGVQRGGLEQAGLLGLFRTDNAFADSPSWIKVPTGQTNDDYCGWDGRTSEAKCGYVHFLSVDPGNPNSLFAGGRNIWRCTNCAGAPTWNNVNFGTADFHAIAWVGNRLIVGNDYGVYSTTSFGAPWQNHNSGLPTAMFYSGALHPSKPEFILGGFRDFGTVVQENGNRAWRALPASVGGEGEVAISTSHPDTDWMTSRGVIMRTTDGGKTAIRADDGIDWSSSAFVQPVRKCPNDDNVFLVGTNRMWRTNNFFNSTAPLWTVNSPGGDVRSGFGRINSIAYVASDTKCNSYAYGLQTGRVLMTQDGGAAWMDLDPRRTLPPRPINWLVFDPTDPSVLYAAVSNFDDYPPGRPGHVFKTTNVGTEATWRDISPPSNTPFNVVAIDPRNSHRVYAGSDQGLWHSNDGGATWIKDGLDVGLPNVSVYDIQINPATNRTVIFTYGRGAYALTLSR